MPEGTDVDALNMYIEQQKEYDAAARKYSLAVEDGDEDKQAEAMAEIAAIDRKYKNMIRPRKKTTLRPP